MREVRWKHPRNACRAQKAAVALRDVVALQICCAFASFDSALTEMTGGAVCGSSPRSLVDLRSQLVMARAAICRLARCSAKFKLAVHRFIRAPLSAQEVADTFVAYGECTAPVVAATSSPSGDSPTRSKKKRRRTYSNKSKDVERRQRCRRCPGSCPSRTRVWKYTCRCSAATRSDGTLAIVADMGTFMA